MSILEQIRAKAYKEGWAQAAQISYDDAHEKWRSEGWTEGYRAGKWRWFAGALIGFVAGWLV